MSQCFKKLFCKFSAFCCGFALGQVYYYYLLQKIPFPGSTGVILSIILSLLLGLGNVVSEQLRCIYLLLFPMYCGKPGRGVIKAMILTYIVTGPITNMGLNAKEVVRVYACCTQLSYNMSLRRHSLMQRAASGATAAIRNEVKQIKDDFRSIQPVIEALEQEIEGINETVQMRYENDIIDELFSHTHRSYGIERYFQKNITNNSLKYETMYRKKLQYRCEHQISHASAMCFKIFKKAFIECCEMMSDAKHIFCWKLLNHNACDFISELDKLNTTKDLCLPPKFPGLGKGYEAIKNVKMEFVERLKDVKLQKLEELTSILDNTQSVKVTIDRVQEAFKEKTVTMHFIQTAMDVCMALLFLRIFAAAVNYHDLYLTNIDYDNVFITGYFKRLDDRRGRSNKYTLLPLKKMERSKYIDVFSLSHKESQRSNLLLQILKVMLEVVTATTFVMLDRLFFEALEVVRQHAEMEVHRQTVRDLDIQVEGIGLLASLLRHYLVGVASISPTHQRISNSECLPRPRQVPLLYYFKIYGGYIWIVVLLFANPYTLRLNRLICSYFYPRREKERILHLYNDILKKRMKMPKTLQRRVVQSVRAHYLSGDGLSLLRVRTRWPCLLGWLRVLPAARKNCLICGETQPLAGSQRYKEWHACMETRCSFVYCGECWRDAGACLACHSHPVGGSDSLDDDDDDFNNY